MVFKSLIRIGLHLRVSLIHSSYNSNCHSLSLRDHSGREENGFVMKRIQIFQISLVVFIYFLYFYIYCVVSLSENR